MQRPDIVVAVADATNLARSLYLPLQLIDLGFRVVVAVNLSDEARRRKSEVDAEALSRELGVPVVATSAPRGEGLGRLSAEVAKLAASRAPQGAAGTPLSAEVELRLGVLAEVLERSATERPLPFGLSARAVALGALEGDEEMAALLGEGGLVSTDEELAMHVAQARHAETRRLAGAVQRAPRSAPMDRLWRLATTPRTGVPILLGVLAAMFAVLFVVGELLSRLLTTLWTSSISPALDSFVKGILGDGVGGRIVLWGLDGGILATLAVGIPYILTFYLILAFVEDSGYMNAAAFLSDRVMHRFGLHGRAVVPLIAAGGCNVPAVIATRSLRTMRERVIASTLATLVPCSARTAVIVGAVAGVAGWQYAVLTYVILFAVIVTTGLVLNRFLPGRESAFVMEMFPLRRPVARQVLAKTWRRFREFVWDAAPIILLGSTVLGALYETNTVWRFTSILAPVVEGWLLLPSVAGLTLLFAVLRKELALQLLLVFAAVSAGGAVLDIGSVMTTTQIVTYAVVNSIYIPCIATIAVLGREIGWWRTAVVSVGTIVVAVAVGGVLARILLLFGS